MALPKSKDLDEILKAAAELSTVLKEVKKIPIPETIEKAIKDVWILEVIALNITQENGYTLEARNPDRQRVVRIDKAMEKVEEFEDWLIEKEVDSSEKTALGLVRLVSGAVGWLYDHAGDVISVIWELARVAIHAAGSQIADIIENFWDDPIEAARRAANAVIDNAQDFAKKVGEIIYVTGGTFVAIFFVAQSAPGVSTNMISILRQASIKCEQIRKAALPQRSGPRIWRRKTSRL